MPKFLLLTAALLAAPLVPAAPDHAVPRFDDDGRRERILSLVPEIDREFTDYAAKKNYPGLAWGIVLDGELIHSGKLGLADTARRIPVGPATRFRIASMSKSFTALAILRLRDAGRLALTDPVTRHLPEFATVAPLTTDSPAVTLQHLLTMTAGFPEDNPWGDRQLAVTPADLRAFLRRGVALSTPAGTQYEYSNLAYALLGEVISTVAREPYQRFITREILQPLSMRDTVWEYTEVPAEHLALGYRSRSGGWEAEPLLHDGAYGAMGGLLTTIPDLARYVAFHLAAWPPRDDAEHPVARRATLREMHQPSVVTRLDGQAKDAAGQPLPTVSGYGYGLRWTLDARGVVTVGHSGGLPGFGSQLVFYPEHGLGIVSCANLTYAGTGAANARVGALILDRARLPRRSLPASAILAARARQVAALIQSWDPATATPLVAENFFLDRSREQWATLARETLARAGRLQPPEDVRPENQLRGTFGIPGEHGRVDVYFTLTPEADARLQELRLTFVPRP